MLIIVTFAAGASHPPYGLDRICSIQPAAPVSLYGRRGHDPALRSLNEIKYHFADERKHPRFFCRGCSVWGLFYRAAAELAVHEGDQGHYQQRPEGQLQFHGVEYTEAQIVYVEIPQSLVDLQKLVWEEPQ